MRAFLAALILCVAVNTAAEAHSRHHVHPVVRGLGYGLVHMLDSLARPRAWCGYYLRQVLGVRDTSYNLARNWSHWGHASQAQIGAVIVWPHHVARIVGGSPGRWVLNEGNYANRVHTGVRSIRGAIAVRST